MCLCVCPSRQLPLFPSSADRRVGFVGPIHNLGCCRYFSSLDLRNWGRRGGLKAPSLPRAKSLLLAGRAPYRVRPLGGWGSRVGRGVERDGGALILTGASPGSGMKAEGGSQRAPMLIQAGERSRVEGRARLRQRRGARGGGGAWRSQWPDMPRIRGRCSTAAAAGSQPAGRPHAWVPWRRAAPRLRPGPWAVDQQ